MAGVALNMYYGTDEAVEGKNAFLEKENLTTASTGGDYYSIIEIILGEMVY